VKAALAFALAMLAARPAAADDRITDDTPYKIPSGSVRAGLWKLQYGVNGVRGLEIGTYTLPYATYAFGVRSANGHVKYQFFDKEHWTLAATLGVAYVDLTGLDIDARIAIVPFQLLAARRIGKRLTLGLGTMYSQISGEGSYNEDEATEFRGAVAVDNVQSWVSLMIHLSRGWTIYLETRAVSSIEGAGQGDATFTINDRTTVDVSLTGKASIEEMRGGSSLIAAQYSRKQFRMRFGIGYGNYNIPVINFIVPVATPFPEFDVYWVF
jgi:hypothetical protein